MKTPPFTTLLLCASLGLSTGAIAAQSDNASSTPAPSPSSSEMNSSQTNSSQMKSTEITPYDGFVLGTKIVGSPVENLQKQELGTISDLIVNPDTGYVRFAVLSVGASDKVAVPWDAIVLEKNKAGEEPTYVLNVSKEKLEKAPKFTASKLQELYAKANALPIYEYFIITYSDEPTHGKGKANANSTGNTNRAANTNGTGNTNGTSSSSNPMERPSAMASPSPKEKPSAMASPSPMTSPVAGHSSMATPSPSPAG